MSSYGWYKKVYDNLIIDNLYQSWRFWTRQIVSWQSATHTVCTEHITYNFSGGSAPSNSPTQQICTVYVLCSQQFVCTFVLVNFNNLGVTKLFVNICFFHNCSNLFTSLIFCILSDEISQFCQICMYDFLVYWLQNQTV